MNENQVLARLHKCRYGGLVPAPSTLQRAVQSFREQLLGEWLHERAKIIQVVFGALCIIVGLARVSHRVPRAHHHRRHASPRAVVRSDYALRQRYNDAAGLDALHATDTWRARRCHPGEPCDDPDWDKAGADDTRDASSVMRSDDGDSYDPYDEWRATQEEASLKAALAADAAETVQHAPLDASDSAIRAARGSTRDAPRAAAMAPAIASGGGATQPYVHDGNGATSRAPEPNAAQHVISDHIEPHSASLPWRPQTSHAGMPAVPTVPGLTPFRPQIEQLRMQGDLGAQQATSLDTLHSGSSTGLEPVQSQYAAHATVGAPHAQAKGIVSAAMPMPVARSVGDERSQGAAHSPNPRSTWDQDAQRASESSSVELRSGALQRADEAISARRGGNAQVGRSQLPNALDSSAHGAERMPVTASLPPASLPASELQSAPLVRAWAAGALAPQQAHSHAATAGATVQRQAVDMQSAARHAGQTTRPAAAMGSSGGSTDGPDHDYSTPHGHAMATTHRHAVPPASAQLAPPVGGMSPGVPRLRQTQPADSSTSAAAAAAAIVTPVAAARPASHSADAAVSAGATMHREGSAGQHPHPMQQAAEGDDVDSVWWDVPQEFDEDEEDEEELLEQHEHDYSATPFRGRSSDGAAHDGALEMLVPAIARGRDREAGVTSTGADTSTQLRSAARQDEPPQSARAAARAAWASDASGQQAGQARPRSEERAVGVVRPSRAGPGATQRASDDAQQDTASRDATRMRQGHAGGAAQAPDVSYPIPHAAHGAGVPWPRDVAPAVRSRGSGDAGSLPAGGVGAQQFDPEVVAGRDSDHTTASDAFAHGDHGADDSFEQRRAQVIGGREHAQVTEQAPDARASDAQSWPAPVARSDTGVPGVHRTSYAHAGTLGEVVAGGGGHWRDAQAALSRSGESQRATDSHDASSENARVGGAARGLQASAARLDVMTVAYLPSKPSAWQQALSDSDDAAGASVADASSGALHDQEGARAGRSNGTRGYFASGLHHEDSASVTRHAAASQPAESWLHA